MNKIIEWWDAGREPKCPPDPNYPSGMDVDGGERPACRVALPYPAPRCGIHMIYCEQCGVRVGVTAAGRVDDPRSYMLPCKVKGSA